MSRVKKSRSLKRVTGGVKTGTKERTKIERKRRKDAKKAANPRKNSRQKSVYQRYLDDNGIVDQSHAEKAASTPEPNQQTMEAVKSQPAPKEKSEKEDSLWDMLEKPTQHDTF